MTTTDAAVPPIPDRPVRCRRGGPGAGPAAPAAGVPTIVPLARTPRNLGALALLTVAAAPGDTPVWTVLVLVLTCVAIPLAVGLDGGPGLVRTLLLGVTATRTRTTDHRQREEKPV
ncbi:hypothetical protein O7626_14960 [Micromonospora sp. WMMD1102]|uniref:hypothetical protein n=1 Tax=Micromonospora sp. WMMD1102 TaxID=3016105 RepID=UPI0024158802|nr:hypothetical protein [Micromonospora sp. WMMD1102]MDG4787214.1 hypothetical protein [Micromonospora sp. WMMD1102]